MNRRIAFLITAETASDTPHNDNHQRLPDGFAAAGWQVTCAQHQSLNMHRGIVCIDTVEAEKFDLIWPVGFGPRAGFADRLQLLHQLPQHKLITAPQAYLALHGKAAFNAYSAESFISSNLQGLIDFYRRHDGNWVLKPLAGSLGRDVERIESEAQIRAALVSAPQAYWMLQRYIPEIEQGELRTLICGDAIIGSYLRRPRGALQANLSMGGEPVAASPGASEQQLIDQIHQRLRQAGVGFAAIDTVGGYLMEVNVANPGGLQTLQQLYPQDPMERVISAVEQRLAILAPQMD